MKICNGIINTIIFWGVTWKITEALYGYDCGEHLTNVTTISLMDIGECSIGRPEIMNETNIMALLQLNEYEMTHLFKCSIKISRTITNCGMWSHASRVEHGEATYYREISLEECMNIQRNKYYRLGNTHISELRQNATNIREIILAGKVSGSDCKGGSYSDQYGSYDNVYAAGTIEIKISDYYAKVQLESGKVLLNTGVTCQLQEGRCMDYDGAVAFWDPLPSDSCTLDKYSVLYEGPMSKIAELNHKNPRIMYSLESNELTFALLQKGEQKICGYALIRTEHPKLFILEEPRKIDLQLNKATIPVANLDLFAYMNSKFVYVEKYIRNQLINMYYDILKNKCELERKVFANALSIATLSPSEFGFRLMEEEGYLGVVTGEVVHLVKCIQVEVKQRQVGECYEQLPITWKKENYFLAPRTRIILKTGTQIPCDSRLPAMFKIKPDLWFAATSNDLRKVDKPEILKPQTKPTWTYYDPETLAVGGIYNEKDTRRLRDLILFPLEKPAVLNNVAMGISGRKVKMEGMTITSFIDKSTLEALAESTYRKLWGNFMTFGTASAGVIGLFIMFRIFKLIVDTIIHGYAIYSLYGFSIHLIGAIWNSVTQLLLHLAQQARDTQKETKYEEDKRDSEIQEEMKQTPMQRTNDSTVPTNGNRNSF